MAKRPATFKQADLMRALRAAKLAGLEVTRFHITPEGIVVFTSADAGSPQQSPLDEWMARHAHTT
jgi:hypothetical protein